MALLSEAIKAKQYDGRMIQRGLNKGTLLEKDVDQVMTDLDDDGVDADYINLEILLEGVSGKSGLR